ncbi:MAG TPA: AIR synthase-related protein, partial [Spirochaetales bacterium]|nr:AIR synthase-related protein [Spirochaetales bacterium]
VAGGRRISVKPTLLVTLVGISPDVRKTPSTDFLEAGDLLYLVGSGGAWELGCSILERVLAARAAEGLRGEAAREARGSFSLGPAPRARPLEHRGAYRALAKAISGRACRSCHDLSDGGLAAALAESCLGGRLGAELRLDGLAEELAARLAAAAEEAARAGSAAPGGGAGGSAAGGAAVSAASPGGIAPRLLFSEAPGRLLVSVRPEDRERFERSMAGEACRLVGRTCAEPRIGALLQGAAVLDLGLDEALAAFKTPISR